MKLQSLKKTNIFHISYVQAALHVKKNDDIAKRANFRKPMSVNSVRRYIGKCNLKLDDAQQNPFINYTQKTPPSFSGPPELIQHGLTQRGQVFCGLTSPTFQIVFGNDRNRVLRAK